MANNRSKKVIKSHCFYCEKDRKQQSNWKINLREHKTGISCCVLQLFCAILQWKQENWKIVCMKIKNRRFCLESIHRHRLHHSEANLTSYSNLFSHSRDCVFDIPGNKKSGNIVPVAHFQSHEENQEETPS